MVQPTYNTIEELQQRKEQLLTDIRKDGDHIGELWDSLVAPQPSHTKGELVANLIGNSITAFDAFILVRKLMKTYGHFFRRRRK
jgi:hypothetical protein